MAPRAPKKEKDATPKRSPSVASNTALSSISETTKEVTPSPLNPKNEDAKVKKAKPVADKTKAAKVKAEKADKALAAANTDPNQGSEPPAVKPSMKRTPSSASIATSNPLPSSPLKPKNEDVKVKKTKPAAEKSKAVKAKVEKGVAATEKAEKGKAEKPTKSGKDVKKDAGGKEKVEKVSGEEAERMILGYLKEQNRPYSATEISANLHGKVAKTLADKLLKEMEQNGHLQAKATNGDKKGSQWVFWYPQDPSSTATPAELTAFDAEIENLITTTIPPLKSQLKTLSSTLHTILSTPSTPALAILAEELRSSMAEKKVRLEAFQGEGKRAVKKEDADKIEKEWRYWKDALGRRKKCWKEIEGQLLEGMSREELWEKVGIEVGEGDELWLK